MLKINISGRPYGEGVTKKMVKDATVFMCDILFTGEDAMDVCDGLTVNIDLVDDVELSGSCDWVDDYRNPCEFSVEIGAHQKRFTFLKALGHELAHVRQLAMGWKTQSLKGDKVRWMGKLIDPSTKHYYDLPWEIEAHGLEYGLAHRYDLHCEGQDVDELHTMDTRATVVVLIQEQIAVELANKESAAY